MHNTSKLLLAALTAATVLACAVGGAAARNLSLSEKNFELIWNNALGGLNSDLALLGTENTTPTCPVTLLGNFNERTIKKETGANEGQITHAAVGTCNAGSLTTLTETLSWTVRYESFTGTLPRIASLALRLIGAAFHTETSGLVCEFQTLLVEPAKVVLESFSGGAPEYVIADEAARIAAGGEGFLCSFVLPSRLQFRGHGSLRNLAGTAKITISLI